MSYNGGLDRDKDGVACERNAPDDAGVAALMLSSCDRAAEASSEPGPQTPQPT